MKAAFRASGLLRRIGDRDAHARRRQPLGRLDHARPALVARHEHQDGEVLRRELDRAVQHLRAL